MIVSAQRSRDCSAPTGGHGIRRLLMVTNLFPDEREPWRGLDNACVLQAMRQLRPQVEVRVLNLRPSHRFWWGAAADARSRAEDFTLQPQHGWVPYVPRLGGWNDRCYAWGLRRALRWLPRDWRPDALLLPWLFPDACAAASLPEFHSAVKVAVAQGSDVHQYLGMPMRRRAILRLAGQADIITRSAELKRRLIEAGATESGVHCIHNGVDARIFHSGPQLQARQELGWNGGRPLALFVGNFLPVKGLELLLRAVAKLQERFPQGVDLALLGSGPLEGQLRALAQRLGIPTNRLHWLGRQPPEVVACWLRAADVCCLSSHHEGLPNVILEALSCHCPVVSTAVGGIAEVLAEAGSRSRLLQGRDANSYAEAMAEMLARRDEPRDAVAGEVGDWSHCARRYWQVLDRRL